MIRCWSKIVSIFFLISASMCRLQDRGQSNKSYSRLTSGGESANHRFLGGGARGFCRRSTIEPGSSTARSVKLPRADACQQDASCQDIHIRCYGSKGTRSQPAPRAALKSVPQDWVEPMKWYRCAADQGFADAQDSLARMCFQGRGVPKSYVQARMWPTWLLLAFRRGLNGTTSEPSSGRSTVDRAPVGRIQQQYIRF